MFGAYSNLFAGADLVSHVDGRGWVVANPNSSQTWFHLMLGHQSLYVPSDLLLDLIGDRGPVK